MAKLPRVEEVEEIVRAIAIRIGERLHELENRLPGELKPTVHQLESFIADELGAVSVDVLRSAIGQYLYKMFTTGKGEVKHSPADLA